MWFIYFFLCISLGGYLGGHRVKSNLKKVAYLKEFDIRLSHASPEQKRWFAEGMRYVVTEVTHDDFYYHGERQHF